MKNLVSRLLLVMFGLFLGMAAAEISLRLAFPQNDCLRFAKPDAVIGWVLRMNYSDTCVDEERFIVTELQVNSLNLRGPELEMPKPPGRFRVLFLGDSMTFGFGVPYEETLPVAFGRLMDGESDVKDVEVINAGVPGYGTGQEVLLYERLAAAVAPDLVILVFFVGNDLQDNACAVYNPTRPCFRLDDEQAGLVLDLPDRNVIESYEQTEERRSWYKLQLASFLRSRLKNFLHTRPELFGAFRWGGDPQTASPMIESWYVSETFDPGWPVTIGILNRFTTFNSENGIRLAIVVLPDISQVSADYAQLLAERYHLSPAGVAFEADPLLPQRLLTEWGMQTGVLVIDPLAEFASGSKVNELYLPDWHLSAIGNERLARVIFTILLEDGLLQTEN